MSIVVPLPGKLPAVQIRFFIALGLSWRDIHPFKNTGLILPLNLNCDQIKRDKPGDQP
jgi:hypothetical protein